MRQLVLAAAIVATCAGFAGAQPMPSDEPTLTTYGQGRVQVPPDRAHLTVEVETNGKTLEAATASHRTRAERALNALHGLENSGLKIERSTFRLNEVRVPVNPNTPQGQSKPEYQAATTFELTLKQLDAVDRAITAIAATGLFEVRNIRFGIGDRDPGMKAARKGAIEDARDRAETYADAAGVRLKSILRIEDGNAGGPPELFAPAQMRSSVKVIPPDALTLTATVTVTWRIESKP
jgi:uncharacterized protein YggE